MIALKAPLVCIHLHMRVLRHFPRLRIFPSHIFLSQQFSRVGWLWVNNLRYPSKKGKSMAITCGAGHAEKDEVFRFKNVLSAQLVKRGVRAARL